MIRAQRPVTHHPDAQHRMARLHGEATKEVRPVDNQKEVAAGSAGPGQPPRSQEGRRKRGRIHQLIPLRSPSVEVGDVQQIGGSHDQISHRVVTIGKGGILPEQSSRDRPRHSHGPCADVTAARSARVRT